MPPDQADLFGSMPRPKPQAPVPVVPVAAPVMAERAETLLVAGITLTVDEIERELNRLHKSVTAALSYRNTLCVTARDLALAAMGVEHLQGRAMRVLRAWQDQEVALTSDRKPVKR